MHQINIHEAKTHLSRLLEEVEAGEEVIIARNGRPIARLVPHKPVRTQRKPGALKGKIWLAEDFNETPRELIDEFYNGPIYPD